jgi:hypothetical protein
VYHGLKLIHLRKKKIGGRKFPWNRGSDAAKKNFQNKFLENKCRFRKRLKKKKYHGQHGGDQRGNLHGPDFQFVIGHVQSVDL